jgi:hypothetical protein
MCGTERISLSVFLSRRVARYHMQEKVTQCMKQAHIRVALEPFGILSFRSQRCGMKSRKLSYDALMK